MSPAPMALWSLDRAAFGQKSLCQHQLLHGISVITPKLTQEAPQAFCLALVYDRIRFLRSELARILPAVHLSIATSFAISSSLRCQKRTAALDADTGRLLLSLPFFQYPFQRSTSTCGSPNAFSRKRTSCRCVRMRRVLSVSPETIIAHLVGSPPRSLLVRICGATTRGSSRNET